MKWDEIQPKTVKWDEIQPEEPQPQGSEGGMLGEMASSAGDVGLELISAINRGAVNLADFLSTDQINNILQMAGSEKQVPGLKDVYGIQKATAGGFMEPGLGREAVQTGGELAAPGAAAGAVMRGVSKIAPKVPGAVESTRQAIIRQLGSTKATQDVPAAISSGAGMTVGGEVGEEIAGPYGRAVGEAVGAIGAPAAAAIGGKMAKPSVTKAFAKAHKLGYKIPPVLAKGTKTQQFMEGTAGPVPTKQKASLHNQQVTNKLIKKELGYPEDVPLSSEGLQAVRSEAGEVYKQASGLGNFKVDSQFNQDLANIAKLGSSVSKEFPSMVKKDVIKLVKGFENKKQVSSEALIDVVKQLRAESSTGFRSQDPNTVSMAKAQGKIANALEGLMERNISQTQPGFLDQFKAARQRIAKTYTIEKALKGENVDAVALGRQLDKGKPLSGVIKDVAEMGQSFKGAFQTNVPQQSNFRPMDVVAGVGAAGYTQQPGYLAAMGARPAIRSLLLSKPYQKMLASVKPSAIKRILSLPPKSQAGAVTALLKEFNDLQTQTQTNSPEGQIQQ